jgi:hypothetical protein
MMFHDIDGMAGHAENTCHIPYSSIDKIYRHQGDKDAAHYRKEFLVFPHISAFADDEKMTERLRTTPRILTACC